MAKKIASQSPLRAAEQLHPGGAFYPDEHLMDSPILPGVVWTRRENNGFAAVRERPSIHDHNASEKARGAFRIKLGLCRQRQIRDVCLLIDPFQTIQHRT